MQVDVGIAARNAGQDCCIVKLLAADPSANIRELPSSRAH